MAPRPSKRKWTPRQQRYIQWLRLVEEDRQPKTREELAQALKVRPETLSKWEKLPEFTKAVEDASIQNLALVAPAVYDVVGKKALAGDFRFVKLLLELNEKFKMRYREDKEPFTEEEYNRAAQFAAAWEKDHFGDGSGGSI